MLGLILQPMPANSYWTDSDNDGIPEEIANPPEGDSWWADDSDGDGMTNAEEVIFLSDPYRLDSDFDGLTDRDERDLTPPVLFGGLAPTDPWDWDSNDNGYSDHDEYFYALQGRALDVNYSALTQFYSYSDADGDGVHNQDDSDPLTMDRDGDGIVNWQDSYMDDYYNGFPPPIDPWYYADDDNDGTINGNDPFPGDWWNGQPHYYWDGAERSGTWSDQDADGIPDDFDPTPLPGYTYNGAFYAGTWSDRDGDGVPDPADPTPDGTYWYGGQEYTGPWTDSDNDGIPNPADPMDSLNSHWYNGTEYAGPFVDTDGDTIPNSADSWPNDPENGYDSDGDGLDNYTEIHTTQTNPNDVDTDDDSLTDGEEALITHSNPNDPTTGENQTVLDFFAFSGPDADNDGLPDFVESHYATSNEPNPTTWLAVSGDLDGDGVTNLQAYWFGWDLLAYLNQYDMDGDGMTDAQEDYWSSLYPGIMDRAVFADAVGDYDNDDVLNFEEVALGMHPASAYFNRGYWYPPGSTDPVWQDGAPDFMYWWFLTHFIPAQAAGSTDPSGAIQLAWHDGDGNGIPDAMEQSPGNYVGLPNRRYLLRTGDYDADGMPDVWEHRHNLNVRAPEDANADGDDDGLTNGEEFDLGTHPRLIDSDGDGFSDELEVIAETDPVNRASNPISVGGSDLEAALARIQAVLDDPRIAFLQRLLEGDPRSLQLASRSILIRDALELLTATEMIRDFRTAVRGGQFSSSAVQQWWALFQALGGANPDASLIDDGTHIESLPPSVFVVGRSIAQLDSAKVWSFNFSGSLPPSEAPYHPVGTIGDGWKKIMPPYTSAQFDADFQLGEMLGPDARYAVTVAPNPRTFGEEVELAYPSAFATRETWGGGVGHHFGLHNDFWLYANGPALDAIRHNWIRVAEERGKAPEVDVVALEIEPGRQISTRGGNGGAIRLAPQPPNQDGTTKSIMLHAPRVWTYAWDDRERQRPLVNVSEVQVCEWISERNLDGSLKNRDAFPSEDLDMGEIQLYLPHLKDRNTLDFHVGTKCRNGYADSGAILEFHQEISDNGYRTGYFRSPRIAIMADQDGDSLPVGPSRIMDGTKGDTTFLGSPGGAIVLTAPQGALNQPVEVPISATVFAMSVQTLMIDADASSPRAYVDSVALNRRRIREIWGAYRINVVDKLRRISREALREAGISLGTAVDFDYLRRLMSLVDRLVPDRETIKLIWVPVALIDDDRERLTQYGLNFRAQGRPDICFIFGGLTGPTRAIAERTSHVAAHEIGHALGLTHFDYGVLTQGTPYPGWHLMADYERSNGIVMGQPERSSKHLFLDPRDSLLYSSRFLK